MLECLVNRETQIFLNSPLILQLNCLLEKLIIRQVLSQVNLIGVYRAKSKISTQCLLVLPIESKKHHLIKTLCHFVSKESL
jgi:hypothetical protein